MEGTIAVWVGVAVAALVLWGLAFVWSGGYRLRWYVRNIIASARARFDHRWNRYIFTSGRQVPHWDGDKVWVWGDVVWDTRGKLRASEFILRMDGSGTWAVPSETTIVREAHPAPHPTKLPREMERRLKKGTKVDSPFMARTLLIQEEDGVVKGRPWLPRRFRKGAWLADG